MATTTAHVPYEEFIAMPEKPGKQELLDGEVIELPPAKRVHNRLAARLFKLLDRLVNELHERGEAADLGEVCIGAGYRAGSERHFIPDVSINYRDQPYGDYDEGPPLLAVEVVSDSNTARHLEMKLSAYLEAGALEVWLVYPESRTVWIHRKGSDTAVRHHSSLTTDLLPGVVIELDALFAS
jgi:Uma2 family endonuclease